MSGVSERANGRVSGPVLQSLFLAVINHSEIINHESKKIQEHEEGYFTGGNIFSPDEMSSFIRSSESSVSSGTFSLETGILPYLKYQRLARHSILGVLC